MLKLYEENTVQALADGVRALSGETGTFTLAEMATAISDFWGSSDLLLSSVYADGTPWDKYEGYRWGSAHNLIDASDSAQAVRYCTGYIAIPAHAEIRLRCENGKIQGFFCTENFSSSYSIVGFNYGAAESPLGGWRSLVWENTSDGIVYLRINSTVPISTIKAKIVSGVTA